MADDMTRLPLPASASADAGAGAGAGIDDDEYRIVLGRRIRVLRVIRGLNQEQLAHRAGVTRNFVSALERAAQGLDLVRIRRLALALDVTLPDLVDEAADVGVPELRPMPRLRRRASPNRRG